MLSDIEISNDNQSIDDIIIDDSFRNTISIRNPLSDIATPPTTQSINHKTRRRSKRTAKKSKKSIKNDYLIPENQNEDDTIDDGSMTSVFNGNNQIKSDDNCVMFGKVTASLNVN